MYDYPFQPSIVAEDNETKRKEKEHRTGSKDRGTKAKRQVHRQQGDLVIRKEDLGGKRVSLKAPQRKREQHQRTTRSMPDGNIIGTRKGGNRIVYPVTTVKLGQSIAVVIGKSLYFMAGLWDRMNEKEITMAGNAANIGREWIEDHPVALA